MKGSLSPAFLFLELDFKTNCKSISKVLPYKSSNLVRMADNVMLFRLVMRNFFNEMKNALRKLLQPSTSSI